eukprot:Skav228547  [mRNA]  locus=scaffold1887:531731:537935:+ [translate_table: standard]
MSHVHITTIRYAPISVNFESPEQLPHQLHHWAVQTCQVWVGPCPSKLDPSAVHAMSSKGLTLFSIPRPPDFPAQRTADDFPGFGAPALSAVAQLREQRPSRATTVRANRYHDVATGMAGLQRRALLLGDAAHSTGGTLGQGANSALTDAVVLDELLTTAERGTSVVQDVGEEFSRLRQPEGLALWKLLQLPPKGPWSLPYLATQFTTGFLSRWTSAPQPVQSLLSETTTPYTQIVLHQHVTHLPGRADDPGRPALATEAAAAGAGEAVDAVATEALVQ